MSERRPIVEHNDPGLTALAYRPAWHGDVKAAMVRALSDARRQGLGGLGARDDADLTIALLDAYAAMADSVGFYVERSADEAYLRTAKESLSVRLLARLVGYEPRPAIAATALLACTLESSDDAPTQLVIEPGLQVQSIPGPGEVPQTFETDEELVARPIWNAIRPRLTAPQDADPDQPSPAMPVRYVEGLGVDVRAGRALIHVQRSGNDTVLGVYEDQFVRRVARVKPQPDLGRTMLEMERPASAAIGAPLMLAYVYLPIYTAVWPAAPFVGSAVALERLQAAQFVSPPPKPVDPYGPGVFVMDVAAPLFAHDRPPRTEDNGLPYGPADLSYTLSSENLGAPAEVQIHLDGVYDAIATGSWIVLSCGTAQASARVVARAELTRARYGVSRRVTRLTVRSEDLVTPGGASASPGSFTIIGTTVYAAPRLLPMIELPIDAPIGHDAPDDGDEWIELDARYLDLEPGKRIILTGELTEAEGELAGLETSVARVVAENDRTGARSRVRLDVPLEQQFRRDSVVINANVVLASHGESVVEPIVSGEMLVPFRPLALKKKPVTQVPASTPSGGETTLEVRVDGVRWTAVPDFAASGPDDRVYATRQSENGATSIVFGDGQTGALPPSGLENVVASYRAGAGSDGRVGANALSLLKSKPQGLKSVVNPIAAAGGADAENLDDARDNAPLKALTLGRAVSLRDYEDMARAFGPIAKARADWVWTGTRRTIFLTVAGEDGDPLAGSSVIADLAATLREAGDPFVPLRIAEYVPVHFTLAARVAVLSAYLFEDVVAAIDLTLRAAYGFDARALAQSVTRSDVIATMQAVEGVSHIDLDLLHVVDAPAELRAVLPAAAPRPGARGAVDPAELLTITPAPLVLEALT